MENRIEMINAYGQSKKLNETLAKINKEFAFTKAVIESEMLWDRAKKVIDMANACEKNGIGIPRRFWKADAGFIGFNREYSEEIDSLRIGYAYGKIVFCNGRLTYSANEDRIMKFVDNFNEFETDFYAFVDETIKA